MSQSPFALPPPKGEHCHEQDKGIYARRAARRHRHHRRARRPACCPPCSRPARPPAACSVRTTSSKSAWRSTTTNRHSRSCRRKRCVPAPAPRPDGFRPHPAADRASPASIDRLAAVGFGNNVSYWMGSSNANTPLIRAALDGYIIKGYRCPSSQMPKFQTVVDARLMVAVVCHDRRQQPAPNDRPQRPKRRPLLGRRPVHRQLSAPLRRSHATARRTR